MNQDLIYNPGLRIYAWRKLQFPPERDYREVKRDRGPVGSAEEPRGDSWTKYHRMDMLKERLQGKGRYLVRRSLIAMA